MKPRRRADHERGQILVIVAGGLVTVLMLMALVIDGGMAFLSRRDTQNQADLAALAGTKVVLDSYVAPGGRTVAAVRTAINRALTNNGCDVAGTTCRLEAAWFVRNDASVMGNIDSFGAIPTGALGVKVDVARETPTFILGAAVALLNGGSFSEWAIGATGTALAGSFTEAAPGGPLMPIALRRPDDGFSIGMTYTLTSGHTAPGNFSWLDFDSIGSAGSPGTVGANDLVEWVCQEEDTPAFTLPEPIDGKPGLNLAGPSQTCIENYIEAGTVLLFPTYPNDDPVVSRGSYATYPIDQVVAFVVTGFEGGGRTGLTITGYFVDTYSIGYVPGGSNLGAPDPEATSYFLGLVD